MVKIGELQKMALVISKLGKAGDIVEKIIEAAGEVAEVRLCFLLQYLMLISLSVKPTS